MSLELFRYRINEKFHINLQEWLMHDNWYKNIWKYIKTHPEQIYLEYNWKKTQRNRPIDILGSVR